MTLEEKREIIVKNKDPAIAALDAVLDTLYNLQAPITDEENNIKKDIFKDNRTEQFAQDVQLDIAKYENVRQKLKNGDFNLSVIEVAYVSLAFFFCGERGRAQVKSMTKAVELCDTLVVLLSSKDDNVDTKKATELFKQALDSLQNDESN